MRTIESQMPEVLAGLARATQTDATAILQGDTSIFPEGMKFFLAKHKRLHPSMNLPQMLMIPPEGRYGEPSCLSRKECCMNRNQNKIEPSEEENELLPLLAQALSQSVEKGLELLEQELLRQPQNRQLSYYKSLFLISFQRRYEEGLRVIDQALQLDWQGNQSLYDQLLYYKGQALQGLGRYEEALQMYDQALEANEDNVTFYAKGKTLCQLRRYEQALQAAEESLDILELATAWSLKGRALTGLKRYGEAITAYDKALHLDPQDKEARNGKREALQALSSLSRRNTPEESK